MNHGPPLFAITSVWIFFLDLGFPFFVHLFVAGWLCNLCTSTMIKRLEYTSADTSFWFNELKLQSHHCNKCLIFQFMSISFYCNHHQNGSSSWLMVCSVWLIVYMHALPPQHHVIYRRWQIYAVSFYVLYLMLLVSR